MRASTTVAVNDAVYYTLSDEGVSYIFPSRLHAASVTAEDLRGGAALLLAALSASGESQIFGASRILRGYEAVAEKFSALGANITLEKEGC